MNRTARPHAPSRQFSWRYSASGTWSRWILTCSTSQAWVCAHSCLGFSSQTQKKRSMRPVAVALTNLFFWSSWLPLMWMGVASSWSGRRILSIRLCRLAAMPRRLRVAKFAIYGNLVKIKILENFMFEINLKFYTSWTDLMKTRMFDSSSSFILGTDDSSHRQM